MLLKHDEENKVLSFERAGLVFIINFHVEQSLTDYRFWVTKEGRCRVVLLSNNSHFGGLASRTRRLRTRPMRTS